MDFDLVIIGGGLVGASLAAALNTSGLQIALVEGGTPHIPDGNDWDSRIYAISPGNAAFLRDCGAWQRLDMSRVQPVTDMRVFGDTGAELEFSSFEIGAAELTCILENDRLQHALWQEIEQQNNLTLFTQSKGKQLVWHDSHVTLTLQDGRSMNAKLIAGADGRDSWVRNQAGIQCTPSSYQQEGVVANFLAEKPHLGIAYQWFQQDGILALLPLPGQRVSMVWSVSPEKSIVLRQMPPVELGNAVAEASQHMLGNLDLITPPAAFPLRKLHLPRIIGPRTALIGDAAHNVHPLAGQGVNLGFRDARKLAELLLQRGPIEDCGDAHLLRRYARSRQEDITSMQLTTSALKHLFINDNPLIRNLRNTGLSITNRLTPVKRMLVRHALQ